MGVATEVRPDLLPRLRTAGATARSRHDAFKAAKELRDSLIVEAIDNGLSQRTVAKAAGISRALVNKALNESQRPVAEFEV